MNNFYCIASIISYKLCNSAGPNNWLKSKSLQKNKEQIQYLTSVSCPLSWSAWFHPWWIFLFTWTLNLFCPVKLLYWFEAGMKTWIPLCEINMGTALQYILVELLAMLHQWWKCESKLLPTLLYLFYLNHTFHALPSMLLA